MRVPKELYGTYREYPMINPWKALTDKGKFSAVIIGLAILIVVLSLFGNLRCADKVKQEEPAPTVTTVVTDTSSVEVSDTSEEHVDIVDESGHETSVRFEIPAGTIVGDEPIVFEMTVKDSTRHEVHTVEVEEFELVIMEATEETVTEAPYVAPVDISPVIPTIEVGKAQRGRFGVFVGGAYEGEIVPVVGLGFKFYKRLHLNAGVHFNVHNKPDYQPFFAGLSYRVFWDLHGGIGYNGKPMIYLAWMFN